LFAAVHPDDAPTLERAFSDRTTETIRFTVRWRHADGRVVWAEAHRFALPRAGTLTYTGFMLDATERAHGPVALDLSAAVLRSLSERLEQMREEERTRIARELHDELGQLLTGAKLDFSSTIRRLQELRTPADVVDKLQAAMGQVDIGIAMVRRIATDLRPPGLDHRDLAAAMEYEARRVAAKSGLTITVTNRVEEAIEPEMATVAFRVFQEALTNAVRHAHATRIMTTVGLAKNGRLLVYICDNGVGMPQPIQSGRSLGLLGMRERARAVGGDVRITGRAGKGTRVLLHLPLRIA
jgi:signal transduction histidine kinase